MRWTGLTRTIFSLLAIGLFPSISTYGQHNYKDLEYPPLNDIQAQSPTRVVLGNVEIRKAFATRNTPSFLDPWDNF